MYPQKKQKFEITEYGKKQQILDSQGLKKIIEDMELHPEKWEEIERLRKQTEDFLQKQHDLCYAPVKPSFQHKFKTGQLEKLFVLFNKWIFIDFVKLSTFTNLLDCKLLEGSLKVKNNRLLAYTFDQLSREGYFASNWQYVIENNELFCSSKGKILKARDLSAALNKVNEAINDAKKGKDLLIIKKISEVKEIMRELKNIKNF